MSLGKKASKTLGFLLWSCPYYSFAEEFFMCHSKPSADIIIFHYFVAQFMLLFSIIRIAELKYYTC